jgi:hypothetical protein
MSYVLWDDSPDTGFGIPDSIKLKWVDPMFVQESESGQMETEPVTGRGHWEITLEFKGVRPWGFVNFLEFRQAHRGGIPFYYRIPFEMAGIPPEAEMANPGGLSVWASEFAIGAGHGPTFLVKWMGDDLEFERVHVHENYWIMTGTVILRQV